MVDCRRIHGHSYLAHSGIDPFQLAQLLPAPVAAGVEIELIGRFAIVVHRIGFGLQTAEVDE